MVPPTIRLGLIRVACIGAMTGSVFSLSAAQHAVTLDASTKPAMGETRLVKVKRGDDIAFTVESDRSGEIHIHGLKMNWPVASSGRTRFEMKASTSGRFRMEFHPLNAPTTARSMHTEKPLAVLEVHPN